MAWETGFWVVVAVVGTVLAVFAEAVVLRPLDWLHSWILRGEHVSPWKKALGLALGAALAGAIIAAALFAIRGQ